MTGPRFDFTINLGHVLTVGALLLTMIAGWMNFDARLTAVERTLATSTATLLEQVKQGAELRALTDRVTRIERIVDGEPNR